jgi:hypothetical protein
VDQLTKIVNRIVDIANAADGKTILGVRLGAALKATFPNFSPPVYQCKNLRQFVKKHVPALKENNYSGNDILYAVIEIGPTSPPSAASAPEADDEPATILGLPVDSVSWKAFSNPGYPLVVIANPSTSEVKTVGEKEITPAGWLRIPKLTSQDLRSIAEQFVSGLSEPARATLTAILAQTRWYVTFFQAAQRHGHGPAWSKFKRKELVARFSSALEKNGINLPLSPIEEPAQTIRASRRPPAALQRFQIHDDELRDLVTRLAATLPVDELRSIRMPIGFVLDALKHH